MRLASFNGHRVGVVLEDERLADISTLVDPDPSAWPPVVMLKAIAAFPQLATVIRRELGGLPVHKISDVRLETPIPWPNKLIAFPTNYQAHIDEMQSTYRADTKGFFLKANSSLIGPSDEIVLPELSGYEVHHECELALIVGKQGRNIQHDAAMDHIFGFTCLIDVTVRGSQERVMRKSYDTFTPVGPYVVTADEVPDPHSLELGLWVNGERRQHGNTRDFILDIPSMISLASSVTTLFPGDIIATGTPAGVGPIQPGDEIHISIPPIGSMTVPVTQGRGGSNVAFESECHN